MAMPSYSSHPQLRAVPDEELRYLLRVRHPIALHAIFYHLQQKEVHRWLPWCKVSIRCLETHIGIAQLGRRGCVVEDGH
jgi:hypothetical protein